MTKTSHRKVRRLTAVLAALLLAPLTALVAPAGACPGSGSDRSTVTAGHAARIGVGRSARSTGRAGSTDTDFGRALVGSAPVGRGPSELAVNPRTHTIYVTNGNAVDGPNAGGDTVSVVDTRRCHSGDVSRCHGPWPTIVVGNRTPDDLPSGVAVDVATDTVYVANVGANTVSVFDGATCNAVVTSGCGQVPAEVPVGRGTARPDHRPDQRHGLRRQQQRHQRVHARYPALQRGAPERLPHHGPPGRGRRGESVQRRHGRTVAHRVRDHDR